MATLELQHHREVVTVAEAVAHDVRTTARRAGTADIDAWFSAAGAGLRSIVANGFTATAKMAVTALAEQALAAGHEINPVAAVLDPGQLLNALRITGPVAFKQAMARTGDVDVARSIMADRLAGSARRLTLAGSRDTTFATADAEPAIVGYQRVTSAGACEFCQMLAGRGAVYLSQESASVVVGRGGRPRGTRKLGRAFHDSCHCRIDVLFADGRSATVAHPNPRQPEPHPHPGANLAAQLPSTPVVDAFRAIDTAKERSDAARRRARVNEIRTRAAAERAGRLDAERSAAIGPGKVDRAVLDRWQVTEAQYLDARALAKQIRADIREVARKEADNLSAWLDDNDLGTLSRPKRLQQGTNMAGGRVFRRQQQGYDWLEQLDASELGQVRRRMADSDLFTPDVLAEQVRRKTNLDLSDDEAMNWLVDRWLHADGLRSLASGRLPKYADPGNLIPSDYAMDGYDLAKIFGVAEEEAVGHIAQVQARAAAEYAARTLGRPVNGPPPWELDAIDFAGELEEVERILTDTQLSPGIDPGPDYRWAKARIRELAPPDIDDGRMNPVELHEQIRVTAQLAGLLGP